MLLLISIFTKYMINFRYNITYLFELNYVCDVHELHFFLINLLIKKKKKFEFSKLN